MFFVKSKIPATYPSGLRGKSAKLLFIGSNPIVASSFSQFRFLKFIKNKYLNYESIL